MRGGGGRNSDSKMSWSYIVAQSQFFSLPAPLDTRAAASKGNVRPFLEITSPKKHSTSVSLYFAPSAKTADVDIEGREEIHAWKFWLNFEMFWGLKTSFHTAAYDDIAARKITPST